MVTITYLGCPRGDLYHHILAILVCLRVVQGVGCPVGCGGAEGTRTAYVLARSGCRLSLWCSRAGQKWKRDAAPGNVVVMVVCAAVRREGLEGYEEVEEQEPGRRDGDVVPAHAELDEQACCRRGVYAA